MTDQFRYDGYGKINGYYKTPALDWLANQGVFFAKCYTNSPVCIPARFSLATGAAVHQHGVDDNLRVDLNPRLNYWTTAIKSAGYQTAVIGKTHLHRHEGDLRDREHLLNAYGFDFVDEIGGPRASMHVASNMRDEWERAGYLDAYLSDYEDRFQNKPYIARPTPLPTSLYADSYVGRSANDYLQSVSNEKPWFCWVSFGGPHEPWDAPVEYCDQYCDSEPPPPIPMVASEVRKFPQHSVHFKRHSQAPEMSPDDIAALRQNYAANISLIDDQISMLLETCRSRSMLDNTLVVFTSDHGEMNGDKGLIYKQVFYEQTIRIPLIFSSPGQGVEKGSCSNALVQLSDIGPTILEELKLPGPVVANGIYSKSFSCALSDPSAKARRYVVSEYNGEATIVDQRWKLIVDAVGRSYALYDLENDPDETVNLVSSMRMGFVKFRLSNALKRFKKSNS